MIETPFGVVTTLFPQNFMFWGAADGPRQVEALACPIDDVTVFVENERPRTDERHFALDHVDQLRKLVQRIPPQEGAKRCDPRVLRHLEHPRVAAVRRVHVQVGDLALPAIALTLLASASVARYQRAALLDVLPADYIRTARLKGLTEREILRRHALRNALLPIISLIGLSFPALLTGAFFIEKIFAWPGMGYAVVNAIATRDYPLVVGGVIIGSIMVTVGSLLADLLYAWADPRLRSH